MSEGRDSHLGLPLHWNIVSGDFGNIIYKTEGLRLRQFPRDVILSTQAFPAFLQRREVTRGHHPRPISR